MPEDIPADWLTGSLAHAATKLAQLDVLRQRLPLAKQAAFDAQPLVNAVKGYGQQAANYGQQAWQGFRGMPLAAQLAIGGGLGGGALGAAVGKKRKANPLYTGLQGALAGAGGLGAIGLLSSGLNGANDGATAPAKNLGGKIENDSNRQPGVVDNGIAKIKSMIGSTVGPARAGDNSLYGETGSTNLIRGSTAVGGVTGAALGARSGVKALDAQHLSTLQTGLGDKIDALDKVHEKLSPPPEELARVDALIKTRQGLNAAANQKGTRGPIGELFARRDPLLKEVLQIARDPANAHPAVHPPGSSSPLAANPSLDAINAARTVRHDIHSSFAQANLNAGAKAKASPAATGKVTVPGRPSPIGRGIKGGLLGAVGGNLAGRGVEWGANALYDRFNPPPPSTAPPLQPLKPPTPGAF